MTPALRLARRPLAAALVLAPLLLSAPPVALAQQPAQVPQAQPAPVPQAQPAPAGRPEAANAALLRGGIDPSGTVQGRVSIPDQKAGLLIHSAGRTWQAFHGTWLKLIGSITVIGTLAMLLAYYLMRGRIRMGGGRSGRTIRRFGGIERFAYWLVANCFIVLGLTGFNLLFERQLLLPLIGPNAFSTVLLWGKYAHNFLSFPFVLGLVLILALWIWDNIPNRVDLAWFKAGGGLTGHAHPPAEKFNGGQKALFWVVLVGGAVVAATGYTLMFPFTITDIDSMELVLLVHALVAVVMIAVILAHIYIGSVGMEGAFEAMGSGEVDLNWAKQHHSLWVEQIQAKRRDAAPHLRDRPIHGEQAGTDGRGTIKTDSRA